MVTYGASSFKMRFLTVALNALWGEGCHIEKGVCKSVLSIYDLRLCILFLNISRPIDVFKIILIWTFIKSLPP